MKFFLITLAFITSSYALAAHQAASISLSEFSATSVIFSNSPDKVRAYGEQTDYLERAIDEKIKIESYTDHKQTAWLAPHLADLSYWKLRDFMLQFGYSREEVLDLKEALEGPLKTIFRQLLRNNLGSFSYNIIKTAEEIIVLVMMFDAADPEKTPVYKRFQVDATILPD